MATLTATMKRLIPLVRITVYHASNFGKTAIAVSWIAFVGGLTTAAVGVFGYLIYSGYVIEQLARVMAQSCLALGACGNWPAMLAGLASASVFLAMLTMMVVVSLGLMSKEQEPSYTADEISKAQLLLGWYSMTPRLREWMLHMLDASDADIDEGVIHLLKSEHEEIECMDGNY